MKEVCEVRKSVLLRTYVRGRYVMVACTEALLRHSNTKEDVLRDMLLLDACYVMSCHRVSACGGNNVASA